MVEPGVEPLGRGEEADQGGGLARGEARRALVEGAARRLLDAPRPLPEVGAVEVPLEHLAVGEVGAELERPPGLERLAREPGRPAGEEPRGLLVQPAAPLDHPAGPQVVPQRPPDGDRIDPRVGAEPVVLGGDQRVDHHRSDVLERDPGLPPAIGQRALGEEHPVAVEDPPALGGREPGLGERAGEVDDRHPQRPEREPEGEACRGPPDHSPITITPPFVWPKTSGSYISSARIGGCWYVPGLVARAR